MKKVKMLLLAAAIVPAVFGQDYYEFTEDWSDGDRTQGPLTWYTQDPHDLVCSGEDASVDGMKCMFSNGFHFMTWAYIAPAAQPVYIETGDLVSFVVNYTVTASSSRGTGQTGLRVCFSNSDGLRFEQDVPRLRLNYGGLDTTGWPMSREGFKYTPATNEVRQYWSLGHGAHDSDGGNYKYARTHGWGVFGRISTSPTSSNTMIDPRRRRSSTFPKLSLVSHTGAYGNTQTVAEGLARTTSATWKQLPGETSFSLEMTFDSPEDGKVKLQTTIYTTDPELPAGQIAKNDIVNAVTQTYDGLATNPLYTYPCYVIDSMALLNFWGCEVGDVFTCNSIIVTGDEVPAAPAWAPVLVGDIAGTGRDAILWQASRQLGLAGDKAVSLWIMNGTTVDNAVDIYDGTGAWSPVFLGDFDGTGTQDILWRNDEVAGAPSYAIWSMNGATIGACATITPGMDGWEVVGVADYSGDGKDDILWNNREQGQTAIWVMDGTVVSRVATLMGYPGWEPISTADFSGDGNPDIMWRRGEPFRDEYTLVTLIDKPSNNSIVLEPAHDAPLTSHADLLTHTVSVWVMNGTAVGTAVESICAPGPGWAPKFVGDFNGDAKADILWLNEVTGETARWTMDGTAVTGGLTLTTGWYSWGNTTTAPSFPYDAAALDPYIWVPVAVADVSGDGRDDIIWRNFSTNNVAIWYMDASGNPDAATSTTVMDSTAVLSWDGSGNWMVKATGDLDGDGKADLIYNRNNTLTGGDAAVWTGTGASATLK